MDNSDGSILGVMEDKKGYEMFVFYDSRIQLYLYASNTNSYLYLNSNLSLQTC